MTGYDSWFEGERAPSGAISSRRAAMQSELLGAVRGRRRRRQTVRASLGAGLVAVAIWLGVGLASDDAPPAIEQPTAKVELRMDHSELTIVQGSRDAPSEWVVRGQSASRDWMVGEDQAVELLRESGVRAGFLRVRGELKFTGTLEEPASED